ncbi:efflux RND transporter periplasmic adaptor subunit [Hydrogenophaga sp. 5NK40-0174]|uniref:efflux RND transporter periplasmic adaptor subunit n=1 Tax=Hydrogenophaga sp. 5NK40-0174 TaxID=3127649 RepID=UPI003109F172
MAQKSTLTWLLAAGIAVAGAVAWWTQSQGHTAGPQGGSAAAKRGAWGASAVEVAEVQAENLRDEAQAVGTLRAVRSVTLKPETGGRIAHIGFDDGAPVKKGQLLVGLDDSLQRAELRQAQARLSIARANHVRNQELVAQRFVAQRVLEESKAALEVAEAEVVLTQARLDRMRVLAPFDGTVGLRSINLGEFVTAGADLVGLQDTSELTVDFRLPERYLDKLAVGQPVDVRFDALAGQAFAAQVKAIDPLLDADGRAVAVRASLPAAKNTPLRPGMFARVTVVFGEQTGVLMVPEEAVVPDDGQQFVYRVEASQAADATSPTLARRTAVTLGIRQAGKVQVTQGLSAGQQVVVAGQQRLKGEKAEVKVVDLQSLTPARDVVEGAAADKDKAKP